MLAQLLQARGITPETIMLSWSTNYQDLCLLRRYLERDGYSNIRPPDENCIPMVPHYKRCLSRRISVALDFIFPLIFPGHHLAGLNHRALPDAQQLRLMTHLFVELCKSPEHRDLLQFPQTTREIFTGKGTLLDRWVTGCEPDTVDPRLVMEDREVRHTVDERETGFNLKRKRDTSVSNKSRDSTYAQDSDLTDGLMEARGLVEDDDHEISRLPHKVLVHGMDPLKRSETMPRILRKGPYDHCGATALTGSRNWKQTRYPAPRANLSTKSWCNSCFSYTCKNPGKLRPRGLLVDGLFMALTGTCKHCEAEKTGKWRTDPDVPNDRKTHADGVCDKCYTRWRKTKKQKLGEDSPSHGTEKSGLQSQEW
jgi:hypothetical protein